MKQDERLSTGQIVSFNYKWLVCYRAAGNCLLLKFEDYAEIFNNDWNDIDILGNDAFIGRTIGVIGELISSLDSFVGGFAEKSKIIATNQYIQAQRP
jgi:hypothetical protein